MNPCANKIRNLWSLFSFVHKSIQHKISKSTPTTSTPVKKHLLEMPEPQIGCSIIIIIIIIIIITLFESQIILAEHECCTNWGDCKSNKSNQFKCWFLRRGENRSSRRKTSRSRVENQQTQPTYDAGSGNRTRDTLVEGERSHHYTNPAPLLQTNNEKS